MSGEEHDTFHAPFFCSPEIGELPAGVLLSSSSEGVSKLKYLKLSSFWKEESPKGEVVGKNTKH